MYLSSISSFYLACRWNVYISESHPVVCKEDLESNGKELLCVWMLCNKISILGGFQLVLGIHIKKKFTIREIGTFFIRVFWTHFLTKFAFEDFIWRLQNLPNVIAKYVVVIFEASSLKIVNVNLKESWKLILLVKSVYRIRCDIRLRRYY